MLVFGFAVAAVAPIADGDFFSRDAVLDLLFHPRERSYAVPEIVNFLEAADLRISAFDTDPQVQLAFQQWVRRLGWLRSKPRIRRSTNCCCVMHARGHDPAFKRLVVCTRCALLL